MLEDLLGKNVFIRTVTHYYTGVLHSSGDGFLRLDDAAWIADTGRFSAALESGTLNEVEPYPGTCYISVGGVIDICLWGHSLPRTIK